MTPLTEAGSGVMLALSFALLWQRRLSGMLLVLALQCVIAALMAARQAVWPVAGVELAWCAAGLPWLLSRATVPALRELAPTEFAAAAVLTAVCLPLGLIGPGLAVVLLSSLLMVMRSRPAAILVVALGSLQAGAVAAGLAAGAQTALLVAPSLPALGLALSGGLVASPRLRGRPGRRFFARFTRELRDADFVGCLVLLLAVCAIPWLAGAVPGPWRFDAPGMLGAVLVSLGAGALRWPGLPIRTVAFGSLLIPGAFVAVLGGNPVLAWIGLAFATLVAIRPRQLRLAGVGLGLPLFGSLTLHAAALPACITLLVGLGCLTALGPDLAILASLLLLRVRGELGAASGLDPLLMAAGLLAVLFTVVTGRHRLAELATLGQAGMVVFALGLDTPEARLAAVLQLVLLVLTRLALELAPGDSLPGVAVLVALFPGFTLVLTATAAHAPLLLLPLGVGMAALGWQMLHAMPAGRHRLRPSLAWLPLAAALAIGFALPAPVGAGLRIVAEHLP